MFSGKKISCIWPQNDLDIATKSQGFEHSYYNLNDAQDE